MNSDEIEDTPGKSSPEGLPPHVEHAISELARSARRQKKEREQRMAAGEDLTKEIRGDVIFEWEKPPLKFWLTRDPEMDFNCGYCRFPKCRL